MMIDRQTLLMFDLDGTLIDTSRLFFEGVPAIVDRHLGLAVDRETLLAMWGWPARERFVHFARVAGAGPEYVDRMTADFDAYYINRHDALSTLHADVDACLPRLKERARAIGVVTTRPTHRIHMVRSQPWAAALDFIVCGDMVANPKPAPDGLELAFERYGSGCTRGIYVGDNPQDIKAARACRFPVVSVAAGWGTHTPDPLRAAGPDETFDSFAAFADWALAGGAA